MSETTFPWHRFAVITALAEKAPEGRFGHTAVMKYAYFLQVLRDVPLGYDFTLYAYGPYDAEVLGDLDYAQALDAVEVKTVFYPSGYGYDIRRGAGAEALKQRASAFLEAYQGDVDWVIREFGRLTAAELELASTIVYVDREAFQASDPLSLSELSRRVRSVKPHFTDEQARAQAASLQVKGLLKSVRGGDQNGPDRERID